MHHNTKVRELLLKIRDDDKRAFGEFFRLYYEKFIKISLQYVRGYNNAEDIVSEVFIKILKRKDKLHEIERIDGYLFLMIKNQCLDYLKRKSNQSNLVPLDDNEGHYFYEEADLSKQIEGDELQSIIDRCVENFPPKRKIVYQLIKENGLKHKEVAEILNISPKTVENHLDFALKSLRIVVGNYMNDADCATPMRSIQKK